MHIDVILQLINVFSRYFYRPLALPLPRPIPSLWFHARTYIISSFSVVPMQIYVPGVGPRKVCKQHRIHVYDE